MTKKTGKCKQCGNCCKDFYLEINVPDVTDYEFTEYVRWIGYHRNVETSIKNLKDRKMELHFISPCKYLKDNEDGTFTCEIHDKRPEICKHYPEEDYGDEVSRNCGFRFE